MSEEEQEQEQATQEELEAKLEELKLNLEQLKKNDKTAFTVIPMRNGKIDTSTIPENAKRKQNTAGTTNSQHFNGLEVFYPQFQSTEKMMLWRNNCHILTMRVNPDPRFPEWQVS